MSLSRFKGLAVAEAKTLYEHPAHQLIATVQKEHIAQLDQSTARLEKAGLQSARALPRYGRLTTRPGVGIILAMTITMEVGDI